MNVRFSLLLDLESFHTMSFGKNFKRHVWLPANGKKGIRDFIPKEN